jgi:Right handed beta helix region
MSQRIHHVTLVIRAVGLLLPVLLAVPALAQDVVYTGCIRSADGSLYSVRAGTAPMAPCRGKDKQISWNMAGQPGPQGPPGPSLPPSLNIDVNCDEGQSINAALAQQAERLTVSITGNCAEFVVITRDDVTLQGVGTNPTITAPEGAEAAIVIRGAQRVRLQGLTLTGGSFGTLHASEAAYFHAYQLKISNPTGDGLWMWGGVAAWITESEISGCQQSGAAVFYGSSLYMENSQIIDNATFGVAVGGSQLTLVGTNVARNNWGVEVLNGGSATIAGGCSILDNHVVGVFLDMSQMRLDDGRVEGNGEIGISLSMGANALLSGVIIHNKGGVNVVDGSAVSVVGASTIDDGGTGTPGIKLVDTSMASVSAESSVTGSPYGIECSQPPSVAQLRGPVPDGLVTNCPISQ